MESVYNVIAYRIDFFQRLIFAKQFCVLFVNLVVPEKKRKEKHNIYDMPHSVSAPGLQTRVKINK